MNKFLLLTLLGILSGTNSLSAGWKEIYSEIEEPLYDVYFPVNPDTGFVVGDSGTILRTTDGGVTWVKLNSGVSDPLNAVHFPKDNITGYAVGGKVVYDSLARPTGNGLILKTTDMGDHWSVIRTDTFTLYTVQFPLDAETGYAAGGKILDYQPWFLNVILKTTDGGENWKAIFPDTSIHDLFTIRAICFPKNTQTGYAAGGWAIIKTTDGGESWKWVSGAKNAYDIHFPQDTLTGYVLDWFKDYLSDYVKVYKTIDAGKTWDQIETGFTTDNIGIPYAIYFPTGVDTGFMAQRMFAGAGSVLKTTDGGNTWVMTLRKSGMSFFSIHFPRDNQVGYTVGFDDWNGIIYKTTDGGALITEKIAPKSELGYLQVSPNPFSHQAAINYSLPAPVHIKLEIFDLSGRLVKTLFEGTQGAGQHTAYWNGEDPFGKKLPSGVYFCQLTTKNNNTTFRISKKIIRFE